MTTEEIEKAASEYAKRLDYSMEAKHNMCAEDFEIAFRKGSEFTDKYWQEKTRWIPIEERLPEHTKRVFIKNNIGNVCCGFYSKSAKMWHTDCEMHYFTHWKEIEL